MATLKYINNEHVSTIVVISGLAIRAGSKPNLSAIIGSVPPINLAIITVKNRLMETTMATLILIAGGRIALLIRNAATRAKPTTIATRNSLNIILTESAAESSPRARPRIIRVEL